jgi:2-(1,2-epoxy-1,2-dihydrophenyl)acetyl-CoA isomerase
MQSALLDGMERMTESCSKSRFGAGYCFGSEVNHRMSNTDVLVEVAEGVCYITLNRPDVANAVNLALAQALLGAAIRCHQDAAIRAVVLTGAGRMFCAGGDLKEMAKCGDELSGALKELTVYLHAALAHFARMEKPLVTAINGSAAGAGVSLALIGDIVLAASSVRFTLAYAAAGLVPDAGATFFLPRLIGLRRTQELMFTNRRLDAAEALDWGMITRVVPDDTLATEVATLARTLASGPTRAFGIAKRLLGVSLANSLETQMELESHAIAEVARTQDGGEGIAAFLEKRGARFVGC